MQSAKINQLLSQKSDAEWSNMFYGRACFMHMYKLFRALPGQKADITVQGYKHSYGCTKILAYEKKCILLNKQCNKVE